MTVRGPTWEVKLRGVCYAMLGVSIIITLLAPIILLITKGI